MKAFSGKEKDPEESSVLSQREKLSAEAIQELFRPIREISALWSIDLGDSLDRLLQHLTNPDIPEDDELEFISFSQAGLFLQSSTKIYARKVERLYDMAVNSATDLGGGTDKDGKRKQKVIVWEIDNALAPIEDPEEVDTTMHDDEELRLRITTMPTFPFCLSHSLEVSSGSLHEDSATFHLDTVPD